MNDKRLQELVLQTMQSNSETLAVVSQDIVEVRTITQGVSDRLKAVEEKSHNAPCAHVQTLREKICTSARVIKWFVGVMIAVSLSLLGYWLSRS